MASIANQTCSRYSNHSQLIKIRHFPELFYATYVYKKYNQLELMIEIDSGLLKSKIDRMTFILFFSIFE
jgi:hypothetical protein